MTLKSLEVRDFVLLREARIDFTPGLNVLSGETGAGKSLLVNALGLALGARGSKDLIRAGAKRFEVDCLFSDGRRLMRRLTPSGHNDCRVDGTETNLAGLTENGADRVTIMSQHQQHLLLDPASHLELIDSLCPAAHHQLLKEYRAAYEAWCEVYDSHRRIAKQNARTREQRALWEFQIQELSEAEVSPGEYDELDARQRRLNSLKELTDFCEHSRHLLTLAEEPDVSISTLLGTLIDRAEDMSRTDPKVEELANKLLLLQESLDESSAWLEDYSRELELDPEELSIVEERLELYEKLRRKYDTPPDELAALREKLEERLSGLTHNEEEERRLHEQERRRRVETLKLARTLGASRRKGFDGVRDAILAELNELNMPDVKLEAEFHSDGRSVEQEDVWLLPETADRLSEHGLGQAQLMISTDPKHAPRPLQKVLSGGELSRFMLAVEILRRGESSCLILDEVDTGIGGATAAQLALKLGKLSRSRQLVVITHLAPIAAEAENHVVVLKEGEIDAPGNVVSVRAVKGEERIGEIARMLSGEGAPEAQELARKMLSRQDGLPFG